MPFVTTLTVESGDRYLLEDVVTEIKEAAARKGVELKGPHPQTPEDLRVSQSKRLDASDECFEPWRYTVFTRTIEIVGHEGFARAVTEREFPRRVHVRAAVEQRTSAGR